MTKKCLSGQAQCWMHQQPEWLFLPVQNISFLHHLKKPQQKPVLSYQIPAQRVKKQFPGSPFACLVDRIDNVKYEHDVSYAGRIYDLKTLLEANVYPDEPGRFSILSLDNLEQNKGIFDVEYEYRKGRVTKRTEGDYDIALTPPAAARLLLAGEGHTAQTAVYIDGVELKTSAEDFFRAFPHRVTRFTDSFWSI